MTGFLAIFPAVHRGHAQVKPHPPGVKNALSFFSPAQLFLRASTEPAAERGFQRARLRAPPLQSGRAAERKQRPRREMRRSHPRPGEEHAEVRPNPGALFRAARAVVSPRTGEGSVESLRGCWTGANAPHAVR